MKSVDADLNVQQYVACAIALGLIDNIVTGPLWIVLESKGHISGLNERYARLVECFERWSTDASGCLTGEEVLFEDVEVKKDEVFDCLVKKCNMDGMTKQVLEMLFASFACTIRTLVSDHLVGGANHEMNEERLQQTKSVPKTNCGL